jgi:DNA polymerase III subunit epsilon
MGVLELKRPICFFDIEGTGLDITNDRIVSISIMKLFPDGSSETRTRILNPEKIMSEEVIGIHGITNEMVKDKPVFSQLARGMYEFLKDSDLAGYNSNNYDIPLLCEEFLRCDIDYPLQDTKFVDVGNIFKKKEERTLSAAVRFYCDHEMENAHNAQADVEATAKVFFKQLDFYADIPRTVDGLSEFSAMDKRVDFAGKIAIDEDGDYIYNFGKSKGVKIKVDPSFGYWMQGKSFSRNTLKVLDTILQSI